MSILAIFAYTLVILDIIAQLYLEILVVFIILLFNTEFIFETLDVAITQLNHSFHGQDFVQSWLVTPCFI